MVNVKVTLPRFFYLFLFFRYPFSLYLPFSFISRCLSVTSNTYLVPATMHIRH